MVLEPHNNYMLIRHPLQSCPHHIQIAYQWYIISFVIPIYWGYDGLPLNFFVDIIVGF
jgi:hypothetical protein